MSRTHLDLFAEEPAPKQDDDSWREHWVGMPPFVQERITPYATIVIRIETADDLKDLAERLGQKLTPRTKSIWHPHKPHRLPDKQVWRDAE